MRSVLLGSIACAGCGQPPRAPTDASEPACRHFVSEQRLVLVGESFIALYDLESAKAVATHARGRAGSFGGRCIWGRDRRTRLGVLSGDGSRAAVEIWDATDAGELVMTASFDLPAWPERLRFSPSGDRLVVEAWTRFWIYDVQRGARVWEGELADVRPPLSWHCDANGCGPTARDISADARRVVQMVARSRCEDVCAKDGHICRISCVPSGQIALEIVDVDEPARRARLGTLERAGQAVRFSDDDQQVLIGAGRDQRRVSLPELVR